MDSRAHRSKAQATRFFVLGWFLTLLNVAMTALAVYLPIKLHGMPEDPLFILPDGADFSRLCFIGMIACTAIALLQAMFLPRLVVRMVEDSQETRSAEASLRLAQFTAYLALFVCLASTLWVMRTFRQWTDAVTASS